jgi:hypothetical protein
LHLRSIAGRLRLAVRRLRLAVRRLRLAALFILPVPRWDETWILSRWNPAIRLASSINAD